mmetsp:Transcript_14348/g.28248  ORF Transcript_14348/g.28248 Transcript_14348/m.28248 type:complete len:83 (+) Transcript_14348:166-414(+)
MLQGEAWRHHCEVQQLRRTQICNDVTVTYTRGPLSRSKQHPDLDPVVEKNVLFKKLMHYRACEPVRDSPDKNGFHSQPQTGQ